MLLLLLGSKAAGALVARFLPPLPALVGQLLAGLVGRTGAAT